MVEQGGFNYVAQCVFQAASPYTADKFGLKTNQWLLTIFMLLVSHPYRRYEDVGFAKSRVLTTIGYHH